MIQLSLTPHPRRSRRRGRPTAFSAREFMLFVLLMVFVVTLLTWALKQAKGDSLGDGRPFAVAQSP